MSESGDLSATIDGLNRLLSDTLVPELQRQEDALQQFLTSAAAARDRLRAIIELTEEQASAPLDSAEAALEHVEQELGEIGAILEPIEVSASELFDRQTELTTAEVETAQQHFAAIADTQGQAEQAGENATAAQAALFEELLQTIESACQSLADGAAAAGERLQQGQEQAQQSVSNVESTLNELAERIDERLQAMTSDADRQMQDVGANIVNLLREAQEAISNFSEQAGSTMAQLSDTAQRVSDVFEGDVKDILKTVQELLEIVEKIRPLLEAVEKWT